LDNQGRLVVFLVLSMLILGLSSYFMPAVVPPKPAPTATPQTQSSANPTLSAPSTVTHASSGTTHNVPAARKIEAVPAATVTVETDDYIATFSNQGAVLTGFQLKKYLNREAGHKPVQLVNTDPDRIKPFSLTYAPLPSINQMSFQVEGSDKKLTKPGEQTELAFKTVGENGTVITKKFNFKNGSYLIDFDVTVSQTGSSQLSESTLGIQWADTLGKEEATGTQSRVQGYRVATYSGDHLANEGIKKAQESVEIPAPITWTALANQFFMAAMIPDPASGGASVKVLRDFNAYKTPTEEDPNPGLDPKNFDPRPILVFSGQALRSGESFQRKGQVFVGPQDYSLLKGLHLQLENVVDFGMFGFISVYMLELLKWFFTLGHNWGVAILLLSIFIKLVLWFPTHSSYKNMYMTQQKMKELQPKLEALKRKYPDDKQKQQQETMALYQTAGVNPLGGCLPMFLQMPVFFALYATLSHSIELRGSPFLWVSDLTLRDPFYVLPLLMGVSMIVQQRVSGQAATQAAGQQKFMMWFFPIFLTFISFQWPSGLLVYWVITNLLSIVQQKIVNREIQKAKKKEEA
jgi:YidC/Oxa1 family membrane protein insertase